MPVHTLHGIVRKTPFAVVSTTPLSPTALRSRACVAFAGVLVLGAGAGVAAAETATAPPPLAAIGAPQADPGAPQSIEALMAHTARLRDRAFLQSVQWEVVPPAQMRAQFAEAQMDEAEIALSEKVLKKFGLIPASMNLRRVLEGMLGEQVVGYYDPKTKRLYALDTSALPESHLLGPGSDTLELNHTLVHELTHALQDQHFDLETFIDEEALARGDILDDEIAARLALAEGDAMMVGLDFSFPFPGAQTGTSLALPPGMLDTLMEATMAPDMPGMTALAAAPPYLRNSLFFPYTMGFKFAVQLRRARGWGGVDEAYGRAPESTEQIMHVEKYLTPDRPTRVPPIEFAPVLGPQWRPERPANMGELDVRLLMQEYLGVEAAVRIGSGWDGDRLFVFSHTDTGEVAVVWPSVWDTPAEAAEFAAGYVAVLTQRYGAPLGRQGRVHLWATDAGHVSVEQRDHWVVAVDAFPEPVRARAADQVWRAVAHVLPRP